MPVDGTEIILRNRKISTDINALAKAGFLLERMVEETSREALEKAPRSFKARKAHLLPLSVVFRGRKL